jgi:hypothetical protein
MRAVFFAVMAILSSQPLAAHDYAAGQVWEYKTRPGDEGSLLKIQQIDNDLALAKVRPVFHISIIGFHLANPRMTPALPHAPVTKAVLDQSVTQLSSSDAIFPDALAAIAEWRHAKGGVFAISVAEIVGLMDTSTAHVGQ